MRLRCDLLFCHFTHFPAISFFFKAVDSKCVSLQAPPSGNSRFDRELERRLTQLCTLENSVRKKLIIAQALGIKSETPPSPLDASALKRARGVRGGRKHRTMGAVQNTLNLDDPAVLREQQLAKRPTFHVGYKVSGSDLAQISPWSAYRGPLVEEVHRAARGAKRCATFRESRLTQVYAYLARGVLLSDGPERTHTALFALQHFQRNPENYVDPTQARKHFNKKHLVVASHHPFACRDAREHSMLLSRYLTFRWLVNKMIVLAATSPLCVFSGQLTTKKAPSDISTFLKKTMDAFPDERARSSEGIKALGQAYSFLIQLVSRLRAPVRSMEYLFEGGRAQRWFVERRPVGRDDSVLSTSSSLDQVRRASVGSVETYLRESEGALQADVASKREKMREQSIKKRRVAEERRESRRVAREQGDPRAAKRAAIADHLERKKSKREVQLGLVRGGVEENPGPFHPIVYTRLVILFLKYVIFRLCGVGGTPEELLTDLSVSEEILRTILDLCFEQSIAVQVSNVVYVGMNLFSVYIIYFHAHRWARPAALIFLLLIIAGIEQNPGPFVPIPRWACRSYLSAGLIISSVMWVVQTCLPTALWVSLIHVLNCLLSLNGLVTCQFVLERLSCIKNTRSLFSLYKYALLYKFAVPLVAWSIVPQDRVKWVHLACLVPLHLPYYRRVFISRDARALPAAVIYSLLIIAGVEQNPGPPKGRYGRGSGGRGRGNNTSSTARNSGGAQKASDQKTDRPKKQGGARVKGGKRNNNNVTQKLAEEIADKNGVIDALVEKVEELKEEIICPSGPPVPEGPDVKPAQRQEIRTSFLVGESGELLRAEQFPEWMSRLTPRQIYDIFYVFTNRPIKSVLYLNGALARYVMAYIMFLFHCIPLLMSGTFVYLPPSLYSYQIPSGIMEDLELPVPGMTWGNMRDCYADGAEHENWKFRLIDVWTVEDDGEYPDDDVRPHTMKGTELRVNGQRARVYIGRHALVNRHPNMANGSKHIDGPTYESATVPLTALAGNVVYPATWDKKSVESCLATTINRAQGDVNVNIDLTHHAYRAIPPPVAQHYFAPSFWKYGYLNESPQLSTPGKSGAIASAK